MSRFIEPLHIDGVINSADALFSELKVWRDSNGNGVSEAAELSSLEELDVASLSVLYTNQLNQLITALSAFTLDPGNRGVFTQEQREDIAAIVAASFQSAA